MLEHTRRGNLKTNCICVAMGKPPSIPSVDFPVQLLWGPLLSWFPRKNLIGSYFGLSLSPSEERCTLLMSLHRWDSLNTTILTP